MPFGIPRLARDYLRADDGIDLPDDMILHSKDACQSAFAQFTPKLGFLVGTGEFRAKEGTLAAVLIPR